MRGALLGELALEIMEAERSHNRPGRPVAWLSPSSKAKEPEKPIV